MSMNVVVYNGSEKITIGGEWYDTLEKLHYYEGIDPKEHRDLIAVSAAAYFRLLRIEFLYKPLGSDVAVARAMSKYPDYNFEENEFYSS